MHNRGIDTLKDKPGRQTLPRQKALPKPHPAKGTSAAAGAAAGAAGAATTTKKEEKELIKEAMATAATMAADPGLTVLEC